MITSAALRSCSAASSSASALISRARFSRSASASCAMARCIVGGISTFFIWTRSTLTPQGSVTASIDFLHHVGDRVLRLQDVVERVLAQHRAQRRQRHLLDRVGDRPHLHDGALGIDDAIPDHRLDLDRHVVAGDPLLLLDIGRDGAQIEHGLPLDERRARLDAGPRVRLYLPRRKTTPRSYWLAIRMLLNATSKTTAKQR